MNASARNVAATSFLAIASVSAQFSYAGSVQYRISDLGVLGNDTVSIAYDINNSGTVVGTTGGQQNQRAFIWQNGAMSTLGSQPATGSRPYAINDAGQAIVAVGSSSEIVAGGSITGLGFNALAINASGQVAGAACGSSACQGLIWENGSVSSLPPLPAGYTGSVAFSINDIGQAAGISSVNGSYGATVWSNGTPTYIGNGIASSINNLGQVAGSMYLGPYTHGFVWQNGLLKDIGALSQSVEGSVALDINNSGSVVGYSGANAFIWNEEGMSDLNGLIDPLDPLRSLTWLRSASAINDAGQIVGYGVISGQTHAYMLTPNIQAVPEPESWILMLTGLVVISATIKRKSFTSC